ncbi:MAG: hypothetical protein QXJ99_01220, partial [Thermofilum sp.]
MSVELAAVFGSPNIGVYIYANNKIALLPPDAPEKLEKQVREVLGVETFRVSVAGSRLLGVFIAGNDSGIILPRVARDEEVELLKSIAGQAGLNVTVLKEVRETGLGNLVLTSDKGCMVSSILEDAAEDIADV